MKHAVSTGPARQRGGTLLGFMLGLVLGLGVAVVVALFITNAPVPFVNKVTRPSDRVAEPKSAAETPDPNKPLQSKNRPAAAAPAAPSTDTPAAPATEAAAKSDGAAPIEPRTADARPGTDGKAADTKATDSKSAEPKPAEPKPTDTKTADGKPAEERSSFLLQAGAFRTLDDAENMRGKLALLGYEARVLSADVNGQTMYRVRVGPYAKVDDVNQARSRLAENGIEAAVVRQR
jgi:cell division protein FtsN